MFWARGTPAPEFALAGATPGRAENEKSPTSRTTRQREHRRNRPYCCRSGRGARGDASAALQGLSTARAPFRLKWPCALKWRSAARPMLGFECRPPMTSRRSISKKEKSSCASSRPRSHERAGGRPRLNSPFGGRRLTVEQYIDQTRLVRGCQMNWSVTDAKARLSEVLRLAREGKPQVIGTQEPCVVLSMEEYERMKPKEHLGRALLALGARIGGVEFKTPERGPDRPVTMPED